MNFIKTFILAFIICAFSNLNAQIGYTDTYQSWSRIQLVHHTPDVRLMQQIDHRHDYIADKYFIQFRAQITNEIKKSDDFEYGLGVTLRSNEFRLYETFSYEFHRVWLEQRFFTNQTLWRLRYMIYPRIPINDKSFINTGFEFMIQGKIGRTFLPVQLRCMFDYSRKINRNLRISAGYMACIFQTRITHVVRLTADFSFNFVAKQ